MQRRRATVDLAWRRMARQYAYPPAASAYGHDVPTSDSRSAIGLHSCVAFAVRRFGTSSLPSIAAHALSSFCLYSPSTYRSPDAAYLLAATTVTKPVRTLMTFHGWVHSTSSTADRTLLQRHVKILRWRDITTSLDTPHPLLLSRCMTRQSRRSYPINSGRYRRSRRERDWHFYSHSAEQNR